MNAHIETVENPTSEQPWHNRIIAGNNEVTWTTETFHVASTARESLGALGRMFSPVGIATVTDDELWVWLDPDEFGAKLIVPIRHSIDTADLEPVDETDDGEVTDE